MPALSLPAREEWPEADFDFPDDDDDDDDDGPATVTSAVALPDSDASEPDDDWDAELDIGPGATLRAPLSLNPTTPASLPAPTHRPAGAAATTPTLITIRPPLPSADETTTDEEGVSTIKGLETLRAAADAAAALKAAAHPPVAADDDDDLESDFDMPDEMTQISLRPLSLHHQSSRGSFEWGEKADHTSSSSQSSDAFTSLGFGGGGHSSSGGGHPGASSASSSALSLGGSGAGSVPETETDEDSDELDGLVLPPALFDAGGGPRELARLLERKRRMPAIAERARLASPDPEDDFEAGLVIGDDADFSPSRLAKAAPATRPHRSKSAPSSRAASASAVRPPSAAAGAGASRSAGLRTKSPTAGPPPMSSLRQLRQLALSNASPVSAACAAPASAVRPHHPGRALTLQPLATGSGSGSGFGSGTAPFLSPKSASLRGQKSHSNVKPPSPLPRGLSRKASLSSLIDHDAGPASPGPGGPAFPVARYEAPTAASRAKSAAQHTSRLASQPSSSSLAAARNAAGAGGSMRARAPVAAVFAPPRRSTSPAPPRPPSSQLSSGSGASASARSPPPPVAAPRLLRRPKKPRLYGDGSELDAFADLPTDRERESRFRVQPKGFGNRVVGATQHPPRSPPRARAVQRNEQKDGTLPPSLRRAGRIEFPSSKPAAGDISAAAAMKKKRASATCSPKPGQQRRKPTLIRNLGGASAPKVVGEMKWNPHSLRWEGNDQALREFDTVVGSSRPALITHLTGSSIGSPVFGLPAGARQVGNMVFDPQQMCWISTLPPDEDEPDVFADLADDEHDSEAGDGWAPHHPRPGPLRGSASSIPPSSAPPPARLDGPAPAARHSRGPSESGSEHAGAGPAFAGVGFERGSRASLCVADVDEHFRDACRAAEARHRAEMLGWRAAAAAAATTARDDDDADAAQQPDRAFLFEIRALATRQY